MKLSEYPYLNPARGEVALQIGDVRLGIAVTFPGLARLSRAADAETMEALYRRLLGFHPFTVSLAIKLFSVDDEGEEASAARADAAIAALSAADEPDWREAIEKALSAHLDEGEKRRGKLRDILEEIEGALDAGAPGKPRDPGAEARAGATP